MTITTAAALNAALDKCRGGETIDEGLAITEAVQIRGRRSFSRPVTILGGSIAPANVPIYYAKSLDISDCANLAFEGVAVRGGRGVKPDGSPGWDGIAINVSYSADIELRKMDVGQSHRGMVADTVQRLRLLSSDFHTIQSDGIDFADVDDSAIVTTHIFDFDPYLLDNGEGDHPDGIQFWSTGKGSDSTGNLIEDVLIEFDRMKRGQGIFLSDALFGGHTGTVIRRTLITEPLWHGVQVGVCPGVTLDDVDVMSSRGGMVVQGGPVRPWIDVPAGSVVKESSAPTWKVRGALVTPPGGTLTDFSTEAEIAAAVAGWKGRNRAAAPAPSPAPSPAPVPTPTPAPASKPVDVRALAKEARDLINLSENAQGRAMARLDKIEAALATK
jgi:hypothetical protein